MGIISSGVMQGLIGAASAVKNTDTSMRVYYQAKNKGDTAAMDRALGYAADSMNDAKKHMEETQAAVKDAQTEAANKSSREQLNSHTDTINNTANPAKEKPVVPQAGNEGAQPAAGMPEAVLYTQDGSSKPAAAAPKISIEI